MSLEKPDETFRRLATVALAKINARLTDLEKRLAVAEEQPGEILDAIEKIWKSDPEVAGLQPGKHL